MPKLLKNQTENGTGPIIDWNGNVSPGSFSIYGVWDGAVVVVSGSIKDDNIDNPNFLNLGANSTFSFTTKTTFKMAPGRLKADLSNAGPLTNLNCDVSPG